MKMDEESGGEGGSCDSQLFLCGITLVILSVSLKVAPEQPVNQRRVNI